MDLVFINFGIALLEHWLPQLTNKTAVKKALLDIRNTINMLYPGE